jgi:membrane protease YdiL (CAAX protease family)
VTPEPDAPAIDAVTPAVGRRRRIARWRPSRAVLGVFVALLVSQAVAFGAELATGAHDDEAWTLALSVVVADVVLLGLIAVFAARGAERVSPATLGIRRTRFWPAVGWGLAIYVGFVAAEGLWSVIVGGGPSGGGSRDGIGSATGGELLLVVLAIAVVTPIAEELAFRGYLFAALTRWRGPWIAAVVTGALFGLAHIAVYPLVFLPAMAVVGFGLCLLFWFTGSLLPCVGIHALNNAVVTAVAFDTGGFGPLIVLGAPALAVLLLLPLARESVPVPA